MFLVETSIKSVKVSSMYDVPFFGHVTSKKVIFLEKTYFPQMSRSKEICQGQGRMKVICQGHLNIFTIVAVFQCSIVGFM